MHATHIVSPRRPGRGWRPALTAAVLAGSLLAGPGGAAAQTAGPVTQDGAAPVPPALTQYHHDAWGADEGLPQNTVFGLVQTRDGYLWVGTLGGIARFDGRAFTTYTRATTPGLGGDLVRPLLEDRAGRLWVGVLGGPVGVLDGRRFAPAVDTGGRPLAGVLRMAESPDGTLWALAGSALYRGSPADRRGAGGRADGTLVFRPYRLVAGGWTPPPRVLRALAVEPDGTLWVGTYQHGLVRVPMHGAPTRVTRGDGLPDDDVWVLAPGPDGVWVGTNNGLARVRVVGGGGTPARLAVRAYTERDGLPHGQVNAVLIDRHGDVWAGTDGGGLGRLRGGRFTTLTEAHGLSNDVVRALAEDREGNVWVGTRGGLDRLRAGAFAAYTRAEGLPTNAPGPIVLRGAARAGGGATLWVAPITGGLTRVRLRPDGTVEAATPEPAIPRDDKVFALAVAADGGMWVGRFRGGLTHLNPGAARASVRAGVRTYTTRDGLPDNEVFGVAETRDGTVWVGTAAGLAFLPAGDARARRVPGIPTGASGALLAARDGSVWSGGSWGLAHVVGGAAQRTYGRSDGLPSPLVTALLEPPDGAGRAGAVWVGTGAGLARMRGGRLRAVPADAPAPLGAPVVALVDDGLGALWLSGTAGIARVRWRALDAYLDGGPAPTVDRYGTLDGLRGAEGVTQSRPAGLRGADGRLWFATSKGVAVVDPARLPRNAVPPPIYVEGLIADGRAIDSHAAVNTMNGVADSAPPRASGAIRDASSDASSDATRGAAPGEPRIPAGTDRVEIRYTAPSLLVPERVTFEHRLEGFDRGWVAAGVARAALYTRLPPGRYVFRVRARNDAGVWSAAAATQAFTVAPYFYQTPWFAAAVGLAAAAAAWSAYRARARRVRAQFALVLAERTRIARELHDTLLQGFIGVALQMRGAVRRLAAPPEVAAELDQVLAQADRTIAEARGAVWDLRAPGGPDASDRDLPGEVAAAVRDLTAGRPIAADVEVVGTPRPCPAETHAHLVRIAREGVANAVVHAGAAAVRVRLRYDRGVVRLSVHDDGRGFDATRAAPAGHWGLLGMRERAARAGGTLTVESAPGAGTTITAVVPA